MAAPVPPPPPVDNVAIASPPAPVVPMHIGHVGALFVPIAPVWAWTVLTPENATAPHTYPWVPEAELKPIVIVVMPLAPVIGTYHIPNPGFPVSLVRVIIPGKEGLIVGLRIELALMPERLNTSALGLPTPKLMVTEQGLAAV